MQKLDENFPKRLRALRLEKGSLLKEVSDHVGCDVSYMHRLEVGKALKPRPDLRSRIAAYYRVNPDWLFYDVGEREICHESKETSLTEDIPNSLQPLNTLRSVIASFCVFSSLKTIQLALFSFLQDTTVSDRWREAVISLVLPWAEQKKKIEGAEKHVDKIPPHVTKGAMAALPATWDAMRIKIGTLTARRGERALLARSLGIRPQHLNHWLKGTAQPTADLTLRLLAWVSEAEVHQKKRPADAETSAGLEPNSSNTTNADNESGPERGS